jgi:hypothetical protein
MLTIFTVPKPFIGHIGVIQRNAILSWLRLHPDAEIFVFGDEAGTAEATRELRVRHIPEIAKNEHGTPLVNDLFTKAQQLARHDLICFVNCDIILTSDFLRAVQHVMRSRQLFLLVGECWNLDVESALCFDVPRWETELQSRIAREAKRRGHWAIDYFAFPRGLYRDMPPFAVGRAGFDNWLIWKARDLGGAVIDATAVTKVVHQNHNYAHIAGGQQTAYHGAEAQTNLELAGGRKHFYSIGEATYYLTPSGIRRSITGFLCFAHIWNEHLERPLHRLNWQVLELTRPLRHGLGLHIVNYRKIKSWLGGRLG